ncbi:MAG: BFD-like [2Fe-2S] binding domain [Actinomycetota bacterium]|jgi:bacterioferritin-associated ferredoxin|nr:BFD-like [2Fe-2S] binding domain [Actinomycetota bacterium]
MYACLCRAVTEKSVREVVAAGASTVAQVRATCGAGTGCGGCLPSLKRLLRECRGPGLACTAATILDPGAGPLESTCSGNCAQATGPFGEPMCVAGLGDVAVGGRTPEVAAPVTGVTGTTLSFA